MRLPLPSTGWITAPGSIWPQSTRIVQRKRQPTAKVDSRMVFLAKRGGIGSKHVTLRGRLRRAIPGPPRRVRYRWCRFYADRTVRLHSRFRTCRGFGVRLGMGFAEGPGGRRGLHPWGTEYTLL